MRISPSPDVRAGPLRGLAAADRRVSKSPSDETRKGALLFPRIDEKWSIDRRIQMFLEHLKKKMRALRPASRRHDGSAGGIATAATCALIGSTFP
jgi:hypothetical protein